MFGRELQIDQSKNTLHSVDAMNGSMKSNKAIKLAVYIFLLALCLVVMIGMLLMCFKRAKIEIMEMKASAPALRQSLAKESADLKTAYREFRASSPGEQAAGWVGIIAGIAGGIGFFWYRHRLLKSNSPLGPLARRYALIMAAGLGSLLLGVLILLFKLAEPIAVVLLIGGNVALVVGLVLLGVIMQVKAERMSNKDRCPCPSPAE